MKRLLIVFAATLALAACGGRVDVDPESVPFEYSEDAEITQTDSGLIIITEEAGDGMNPVIGDRVAVHYTGKLADGTEFDSSLSGEEEDPAPFEFQLGIGQVIDGWDEGINELSEGAEAILIIPPELGYGDAGSPPTIPGGETLYFEVELVEVTR